MTCTLDELLAERFGPEEVARMNERAKRESDAITALRDPRWQPLIGQIVQFTRRRHMMFWARVHAWYMTPPGEPFAFGDAYRGGRCPVCYWMNRAQGIRKQANARRRAWRWMVANHPVATLAMLEETAK